jgi:gamma-glutamyltranspeptidase/glutathione hydrolase
MQPQGHVQLASALLDLHLDPQSALELPRFCIEDGTANGQVAFEVGISESIISELARIGHNVCPTPLRGHQRSLFGNGQIITRDSQTGVLCAGSDPRCDGCAIGY